jgi:hypothetical protein
MSAKHLSLRTNRDNPNHHLWNNNGTWWCHFTVHRSDFTKQRVRQSLRTRRIEEAREIRDFVLVTLPTSAF